MPGYPTAPSTGGTIYTSVNDLDKIKVSNFYMYSSEAKAKEALQKNIPSMGTFVEGPKEFYVKVDNPSGIKQVCETVNDTNYKWIIQADRFMSSEVQYIRITKQTTGYMSIEGSNPESAVTVEPNEYPLLDTTTRVTKKSDGTTVTRTWAKIQLLPTTVVWVLTGDDINNSEDVSDDFIDLSSPTYGYEEPGDEESKMFVEKGRYKVLERKQFQLARSDGTVSSWLKIIYRGKPIWIIENTSPAQITAETAVPSNTDSLSGREPVGIRSGSCKNTHFCSYVPPPGTEGRLADFALPYQDYLYSWENSFNSYIVNLITGSKIEFFMPGDISDSVSANFDAHDIRGASNQIHGYNSTGSRGISFSVELLADYCPEDMYSTIAKFKALAYPVYNGVVIAPWCLIKLGDIIHSDRYIINNVSVSYDGNSAMIDNMYTHATVSIDAVWVPAMMNSAVNIENSYVSFAGNERSLTSPYVGGNVLNTSLVNLADITV